MSTPNPTLPDFSSLAVEDILRWVNDIRIRASNGEDVPDELLRHAIAGAQKIRERRANASRSPNAKAASASASTKMSLDDL